jgi:RES domain-containing protein
MLLHRIAPATYPPFDGGGSLVVGGRWHAAPRRIIYCGPNISACRLELLANHGKGVSRLAFVHVTAEVPDDIASEAIDPASLGVGWDAIPPNQASRAVGNAWYDAGKSLLLRVPSVASRGEWNILVNQEHADFGRLVVSKPVAVDWDPRTLAPKP